MNNNQLQKLMFHIGLSDKLTGGLNRMMAKINRFTSRVKSAFMGLAVGIAGIFASMQGAQGAMMPALEVNRALGEVASLLSEEQRPRYLKSLQEMALETSAKYGMAADGIIRASYDIQSAIAGLSDRELASFTKSSAILAMGTKADTEVITDYVGTMYGIFKKSAARMGKAQWIEALVGKTATAVQQFKTTGQRMSNAFVTLGADATALKVPLSEQMAVLGMLQAQMSGSEAGTKYRAFLAGVGKAQKVLNMTFTNARGELLPLPQVLAKIAKKYGDVSKVADSDLMLKAFGSKQALAIVKLLGTDIKNLKANIVALGKVKGLDKATQMAETISDPWERATESVKGLAIALGQPIFKIIDPWADQFSANVQQLIKWAQMFPNLARAVAIFAIVVVGTVALVSALAVGFALVKFMMIGWSVVASTATAITTGLTLAYTGLKAALIWTRGAIVGASMAATMAGGKLAALKVITLLVSGSIWTMTTALLANPLVWIPAVVIGVIAALAALVIYWDDITAAVGRTWDSITGFLGSFLDLPVISGYIEIFSGFWGTIYDGVKNAWKMTMKFFDSILGNPVFKTIGEFLGFEFEESTTQKQTKVMETVNKTSHQTEVVGGSVKAAAVAMPLMAAPALATQGTSVLPYAPTAPQAITEQVEVTRQPLVNDGDPSAFTLPALPGIQQPVDINRTPSVSDGAINAFVAPVPSDINQGVAVTRTPSVKDGLVSAFAAPAPSDISQRVSVTRTPSVSDGKISAFAAPAPNNISQGIGVTRSPVVNDGAVNPFMASAPSDINQGVAVTRIPSVKDGLVSAFTAPVPKNINQRVTINRTPSVSDGVMNPFVAAVPSNISQGIDVTRSPVVNDGAVNPFVASVPSDINQGVAVTRTPSVKDGLVSAFTAPVPSDISQRVSVIRSPSVSDRAINAFVAPEPNDIRQDIDVTRSPVVNDGTVNPFMASVPSDINQGLTINRTPVVSDGAVKAFEAPVQKAIEQTIKVMRDADILNPTIPGLEIDPLELTQQIRLNRVFETVTDKLPALNALPGNSENVIQLSRQAEETKAQLSNKNARQDDDTHQGAGLTELLSQVITNQTHNSGGTVTTGDIYIQQPDNAEDFVEQLRMMSL